MILPNKLGGCGMFRMKITPYGTEALLINFEQRIDVAINQHVHRLDAALRAADLPGVRFSIPAYCSLTVGFDPQIIGYNQLVAKLKAWHASAELDSPYPGQRWHLPLCFEEEFAWDRDRILTHTGLVDWEAFIQVFTTHTLRVFMLGFLPGFPYMGTLPESLACPRKDNPRAKVPAGSVSITGQQAGIYPSASPGGWQIVGRTPIPLFRHKSETPFLLRAGDEVTFYKVDKEEYQAIADSFSAQAIDWEAFSG